ncbi:hypothetical protein G9A89_012002 [Geosiphon pyriformis]|nr:hypothetical protein G9A89_012002 [Geosiphon pyriformis]
MNVYVTLTNQNTVQTYRLKQLCEGKIIAVLNKSIIEPGFNIGVKFAEFRKKRKSGVLEDNIGNRKLIATKVSSSHSWSSETGNTTESDNVDMEEKCLVKETSFDHRDGRAFAGKKLEQTPKNDDINDVLSDKSVVLSPPLKNLVNVSVRKFFTLDISLNNVVKKSTQEKLVVVRKLFSKINGFGGVSTFSKFAGIVRATFTSKLSLMKATKLFTDVKILVNTDFKKSFGHSDRAVVVKKIPVETSVETVHTALSEFGIIKSSILIGKDAVHVAKANLDKQMWNSKDLYKTLFYTLPVGTNDHNIWDYIGSVDEKTCVIDHYLVTYARARCATVCFESAELLDAVMDTTPVLRDAHLYWSHLGFVVCVKCSKMGHTSLSCASGKKIFSGSLSYRVLSDADKSRLVAIYIKCLVPVFYSISFGGVSWAKIVVGSSFPSFPVQNVLLNNRSSLEMESTPHVSLLLKHIDEMVKRLDASGPTVSQLSPGLDIVMSEGLGVTTSGETVAEVVGFDPTVMSKIEETLNNLLITVMSFLAKMNNADLIWKIAMCNVRSINVSAKQKDIVCWHRKSGNLVLIVMEMKLRSSCKLWIKDRFNGVRVFTSGLNAGFLGAGVAIIMNIFLARYVCKISEVPDQLFSIKLLFKNKLSVSILGLYAAGKVNFLIVKTVNESFFVILGGNFNENGSYKCISFKKCSDFGLSNFQSVSKTINYMFVSSSLANAVVYHGVLDVSEHFDTDHQAVSVSMSLGGLLDMQLNFFYKQANKNHWKFNFKSANDTMWTRFKDALAANAAMFSDDFITSKHFQIWILELLVSKIVRASYKADVDSFVFLMKYWCSLDSVKALVIQDLVDSGATFDHVHSAFCTLMTVLVNSEKKTHIYEKHCNRQKTNSVPYNQRTQQTEHPQKYIKIVTIGTIRKDYSSYGKALFQYFRKDLGIPTKTTYTESDFCNYINAKIDCLLGRTTDTGRLGEQIHQSLLGHSTATTTQAIAETLHIINTDIKYYVAQQFPQVQQPVESNPKKYENESNNPVTAQAKSTVNKKPRTLQSRIVFNPPLGTQSEIPQTPGNPHPWNQHSWTKSLGEYRSLFGNLIPAAAQNLAESTSPLTEETAILQPIGLSNKGKQPALAPREHSNMQTPIFLNITSNTPPINRIMAYRDIAKLEKFSGEEDNTYSWIMNAKKAITTNSWNNDHTIQVLPFFLTRTANSWYQSLAEKPISFTKFKLAFLQYFCDPNTLIRLQNQFSIIKQKDHKAVTTYLRQFNQILRQILAIKRDYYTTVQVFNQFIKELWSSILRSIRPCHPTSLQDAIALTHNFESAEQEANHTQTVNLAINGTSDINAKITQLSEKLTQKIEGFLAGTTGTYQPPQRRENNNNSRYPQQQNCQQQQQPWRSNPHNCYYCQKPGHITRNCKRKIMDQNQGNPYQQPRYQQNIVSQYSILQNQPPLYAQQVPYTQPPPQNYYQLPPMTQAIPYYQTSPYSPFRP